MAADNERPKVLAALACMASQPCVYHAPALSAGKANRAERVAEIIGHAATRWLWRGISREEGSFRCWWTAVLGGCLESRPEPTGVRSRPQLNTPQMLSNASNAEPRSNIIRLLRMEALLKNLCRLAPVNACKLLEWH